MNQWRYSIVVANAYLLRVIVGRFVEVLVGIEYTELRIIKSSTSTKADGEMSLATNCLIGPQIRRERSISISQSRRLGRNQVPMKGLVVLIQAIGKEASPI